MSALYIHGSNTISILKVQMREREDQRMLTFRPPVAKASLVELYIEVSSYSARGVSIGGPSAKVWLLVLYMSTVPEVE